MHCYCIVLYCIVLYCTAYVILVSCLTYLLCHSFLCDVLNLNRFICNCQVTNAGYVKGARVYVCVCVCVCALKYVYVTSAIIWVKVHV
jgi:hypothetical protein